MILDGVLLIGINDREAESAEQDRTKQNQKDLHCSIR